MKSHTNAHRFGQTLLELVVSMTISSVLLTGIATSIYIAGLTAASSSAVSDTVTAAEVAVQLRDELRYASFFHERANHSIDFNVADRTGDGIADRIRYQWGGTPGDPLQRSVNGGTLETVALDVQQFHVEYDLKNKEELLTPDPPAIESAEGILIHHSSPSAGGTETPRDITENGWWGQYFHPDVFDPPLPANALSWKITRVEIEAGNSGDIDGTTSVQLRSATGDALPSSTVLAAEVMDEGNLQSNNAWESFTVNTPPSLSPRDGCCLVLEHAGGEISASVDSDSSSTPAGACSSENQGATWAARSSSSLFYKIHGTYSVPDEAQVTVERRFLSGIHFVLQVSDSDFSRVQTGVQLLNTPELLAASCHTDFSTGPAETDANLDGVMDWRWDADGDQAIISEGVWMKPKAGKHPKLRTHPENSYDQLTTVELRCRATSQGGNGATFEMRAHPSPDGNGEFTTSVVLEPDGTQTARVFDGKANGGVELARVDGLSDDFVQIRIVIHPPADRIAVWVNGVFLGSFNYTRTTNNKHRYFTARSDGADVEFEMISVRESEGEL